jgi:HEPN domain-containing protein
VHDLVCFHCQPCAEKYLKALLEELGISAAKTHDFDKLLTVVQLHHPTLRPLKRGLVLLTEFAVDTRCPDNSATKRQAIAALRWADTVRTEARTVLGLPLLQRSRKK